MQTRTLAKEKTHLGRGELDGNVAQTSLPWPVPVAAAPCPCLGHAHTPGQQQIPAKTSLRHQGAQLSRKPAAE